MELQLGCGRTHCSFADETVLPFDDSSKYGRLAFQSGNLKARNRILTVEIITRFYKS
jgi:hypothetical protein